jgi:hypothetical protein
MRAIAMGLLAAVFICAGLTLLLGYAALWFDDRKAR